MPITYVGRVSATPGVNGGTSAAIDTSGANFLIISASWYSAASVTVSDSKGNTWIPLTQRTNTENRHRFFYVLNAVVGFGHTFTVTASGSYAAFVIHAFAGVGSADQQNGVLWAYSPTTVATGPITPTADGALVISGICCGGTVTPSATPALTQIGAPFGSSVNMAFAAGYIVQPTAAAINETWSWGPTQPWDTAASIASFLPGAPSSNVRVTQAVAEIIEVPPSNDVRVTQLIAETISFLPPNNARVSQLVVETVSPLLPPTDARVSQALGEVASYPPNIAQVSQLIIEAITPSPGVFLYINGVLRRFRIDSLNIQQAMNGLDRASAIIDIVQGVDTSPRPELGDQLTVIENGVRIFGGIIDDVGEEAITSDASKDLTCPIGAADFNVYPDRRYVVNLASAVPMTLKAVLELLLPYLAPFGVTLSLTQVDGPDIPAFAWKYRKLTDVLNELAEVTAFVWEINYYKELRMWFPGSEVAEFNIIDGDRKAIGDIKVNPLGGDYANRIIFIAGPDEPRDEEETFISTGVTSVHALGYPFLNHYGVVSVNTIDTPPGVPTGFDVRVEGTPGSETYTYAVSAYNGGGESAKCASITIGNGQASPDAVNKIRLDWYPVTGAVGYIIYGRHGTGTWLDGNAFGETVYYDDDDHDIEKSGSPSLPTGPHNETLSDTPGTADWYFNPITKTMTRNLGVLPAGTEVKIRYRVAWPLIVTADDAAEQAARGIQEMLIRNENPMTTATAQAAADQALAKYVVRRRIVEYRTYEKGLQVGQSQTMIVARRELNGQFLITDIDIQSQANSEGGMLLRTIKLQEATSFQGSWRDVYKLWAQGGSGGGISTVEGGGGVSGGTAHHLTHEPGGSDAMLVDNDPVIGSLRTLGTGSRQAAPGNALANYLPIADAESDYLKLDDVDQINRRGTLAARPAATAVTPGTLYSTSDAFDNVVQSNGTAWIDYGMPYDEIAWTPIIGGTGGASGQSYASQVGLITRSGRFVVAEFQIALTNKGTISGDVTVAGLPAAFMPATRGGAILRFFNLNTNWSEVGASVVVGTNYALIAGNAGNSSSSNATPLTSGDLTNTTEFRGFLMYHI